jgi:hypothetical protein
VVSEQALELTEILGPQARLVAVSEVADGKGFTASVTLPRENVPYALPAVIAAGASDAWVSPMSIYYSQDADRTSRAAAEARNSSPGLPLSPAEVVGL